MPMRCFPAETRRETRVSPARFPSIQIVPNGTTTTRRRTSSKDSADSADSTDAARAPARSLEPGSGAGATRASPPCPGSWSERKPSPFGGSGADAASTGALSAAGRAAGARASAVSGPDLRIAATATMPATHSDSPRISHARPVAACARGLARGTAVRVAAPSAAGSVAVNAFAGCTTCSVRTGPESGVGRIRERTSLASRARAVAGGVRGARRYSTAVALGGRCSRRTESRSDTSSTNSVLKPGTRSSSGS